ncbi:MAG: hypothetical protein OSB70_03855 [Myxococcota bacterium]|nr:hypothetical protein [Myxococcota bacterium]
MPVIEEGASRRRGARFRQGLLGLGVGLLGLFVADAVHLRNPPLAGESLGDVFVPDPAVAGLVSLGFGAVVSDFYWLQAIQAAGGDVRITPELGAHLGQLIDVVTTLNPWVDHPYRFAGIWLTQSEQNVRTANRLLRRGIEKHPDDWRNHYYLGFNHFFYLLENAEAAEVLEGASRLAGAPRYLPRLAARLKSESADLEVASVFLQELLRGAQGEAARESYRSALDEIEIEQRARQLDGARVRFRELEGRDIETVDELTRGATPLLGALPSPEPSSLPASLRRGSEWIVDPSDNRIVSTYYGKRYQLHVPASDRERAEGWAREKELREAAGR